MKKIRKVSWKQRTAFIKQLTLIPGLQTVETDDPLKLIIRVEGYSGFDIQKQLESEGDIRGNCGSLSSTIRFTSS